VENGNRYMKIKTLIILSLVFTPALVLAQSKTPEAAATPAASAEGEPAAAGTPKPLQKLTPGVVASFGRYTNRGKALDQGLDDSVPGQKDPSPVTGSVKHIGPDRCAAVLSNGSKDATFSVSFELNQSTKETINSPKKKLFSAVLAPGKSVEREFRCEPADILQMNLKSGKELRSN